MTAREAIKAAAEGRLPEVEPFEMNLYTARDLAQRARQERAGKTPSRLDRKPVLAAGELVVRRALRLADVAMKGVERKASTHGVSAKQATELVRLAAEVDKLTKQHATRAPSSNAKSDQAKGDSGQAESQTAEPDDFAAQIAAQRQDSGAPSDQTPSTQETQGETESAGLSAKHDNLEEREEGEDRFRASAQSSSGLEAERLAAAQAVLRGT
jgi:hypothetical protein